MEFNQLPKAVQDTVAVVFWGAIILLLTRKLWWKPRYIVDDRGERQRVIAWNRGQPVYDPKTWQQRVFEEVAVRRERRKRLFVTAPLVIGPPLLYAWAVQNNAGILWGGVGGTLILACTLPGIVYFIPALFMELVYQSGYQGMQGAKVLDRQPTVQPGREVVEMQKAHGDAQMASEAEAVALLSGKR